MSIEKCPYSHLRKPRTRHKNKNCQRKTSRYKQKRKGRTKIQKGRNRMKNNKTSSRNSSDSLWLVQQPSTPTYVIARNVSQQQSPHP
jgi:hypothetical protein